MLAASECSESPTDAALQAKAVLQNEREALFTATNRDALICLADAVAALSAKLDGLSKGTIPFDGQIQVPHGYVMQKPPTEEAD